MKKIKVKNSKMTFRKEVEVNKTKSKKMEKSIFFIVGIGIILAGLLVYNVYNVQKENTKVFEDPGYILQSASSQSQKIDKYYFNADEEYKIKNNQKVIFKDTSGDEVTTGKDNFIHYNNGSISSLKKGVLINLANIEQDPITYYSIAANQVVNKQGDNYWINHLNGRLQFTNLIWKISDTKYLIAGNGMTVSFALACRATKRDKKPPAMLVLI